MKTSTAIGVLGALVIVILAGWWITSNRPATPSPSETNTPIATAAFACDNGKSIGASFYQGSTTAAAPDQPPTPSGSVALQLSDGRTMTLPQTISGSGIRYANADESFVFWGKGNTAFVQEGADQKQTYSGCIVVAPDPTATLPQIFATSTAGFSIRFPQNYTVDQAYTYQALGPGKDIKGVKMTIPAAATTGTNLSKDSYVSVEQLPSATSCTADLFLDSSAKTSTFADSGVTYSVATGTDAGAGNIYDEAVFAIPGSNPCIAVRYFIHSSNIGNYPEGTVKEFDKAGIVAEFDNIRRSLVLGQ
jgi:membrane-bound inhibitor of C-type lysozyme